MDKEPDFRHLETLIKKMALRIIVDMERESPSYPDDLARETKEYQAAVIGVAGQIVLSFAESTASSCGRQAARDFAASFVSRLMGHIGEMTGVELTTIVTNTPERFCLEPRDARARSTRAATMPVDPTPAEQELARDVVQEVLEAACIVERPPKQAKPFHVDNYRGCVGMVAATFTALREQDAQIIERLCREGWHKDDGDAVCDDCRRIAAAIRGQS